MDDLRIFRQSRAAEVGERVRRDRSLQSLDRITIDGVEIVADAAIIHRLQVKKEDVLKFIKEKKAYEMDRRSHEEVSLT